jgi:tRNA modification GTPase
MSTTQPASRASVLTPAGRGAVAVVSASGSAAIAVIEAHFHAANGRRLLEQPADRIVFGHWQSGEHREEVVVVRGEDESVEIHCHGGAAASERVIAALAEAGCEIVPWDRWLEQAADCLITAEADLALARATTRRTAGILLDQRSGALRSELAQIQKDVASGQTAAARQRLALLLERAAVGLHLTQPWQVAIAGRPNVGKSSLINALVGYHRAIVFNQPGTTRDVLTAETAIDGWPVRLTDAAGLRETADSLEAEGVRRARRQLNEADLVLWVLDASVLPTGCDARSIAEREFAQECEQGAGDRFRRVVTIVNKVDLVPTSPVDQEGNDDVIWASALKGTGLDSLLAAITTHLVPAPPQLGEAVPFTQRHVDALYRAERSIEQGDVASAVLALRILQGEMTSANPSPVPSLRGRGM